MKYMDALNDEIPEGTRSIFLAGGITNCPDWQLPMKMMLRKTDLTILNPRRRIYG